METYILREGVLNDNELLLADEGKVFKGNYVAILKEYSFLNSWSNKLNVKRFRKLDRLTQYLNKNYSKAELENLTFF